MALAASTGSPSMKAIAVGPLSSGARSEKPTESAARFVRVFLTTAYVLPSPRERRSWVSWATVSPRYSVSTAALEFWNRSVISSITAAFACVGMGLLSSVGRPPAGARRRTINGPGDEERPGAGRTGRGADACAADRTVLLRGSPGAPGPSIARGRATTSGLGGNVDKSTRRPPQERRGPRSDVRCGALGAPSSGRRAVSGGGLVHQHVAGAVRVDRDARAHRRGDGDLLQVPALGRRRLGPQDLVQRGRVVLDQLV